MRPVQIGQCHATIHATSFLHFDTPSTLVEHNMITCEDEIRRRGESAKFHATRLTALKQKSTIPTLKITSPFFFLSGKEEYFFFSIIYTVNLLRLETFNVR